MLSNDSQQNLKIVKKIKNNKLFESIKIDNFLNNNKLNKIIGEFYHISKRDNIEEILTQEKDFNPNDNRIFDKIKILDGFNNKNSKVFKEYLKLNKHTIKNIKIKDIDLKFTLHFFTENNDKILIKDIINRFIIIMTYFKRSKRLENLYNSIKRNNLENNFDIYLFLYDLKRSTYKRVKKDIDGELYELKTNGCYNCSSGYTSIDIKNNNKKMVITRKSEVLGLLTHELGHLIGYDLEVYRDDTTTGMMRDKNTTDYHRKLLNRIGINDARINEGLCNANTTIINTICNSITDDYNQMVNLFGKYYRFEILYSIYHSAKILYWLGYNDFDDFFDKKSAIKYKQFALLFEYTILRSFMLLTYEKLFNKLNYFVLSKDDINNDWGFWNEYIDNTLELMAGINRKEIRNKYANIFDTFMDIIKNNSFQKTENMCGEINMNYFCLEFYSQVMFGGGRDYRKQYLKYKERYMRQKEIQNKN